MPTARTEPWSCSWSPSRSLVGSSFRRTRSNSRPLKRRNECATRSCLARGSSSVARDPGQDDRAIARDPEPPEVRLALTIGGDLGRGGPLCGAGEDDVRRQALEQVGVLGRPAAVAVLELAVGPGQLEGPGRRVRLVVLVGQGEGLLARDGHRGREGDDGRPSRLQPDPQAQAEDRVEHRAGRARERRAGVEGRRIGGGPAAAEEAGAVGLVLDLALERGPGRREVHGRDVDGPDRLLVGRSGPAPAEQGVEAGHPLGLQEELPEGRVGQVGRGGGRGRPRRSWSAPAGAAGSRGWSASRGGPRRGAPARRPPPAGSRCPRRGAGRSPCRPRRRPRSRRPAGRSAGGRRTRSGRPRGRGGRQNWPPRSRGGVLAPAGHVQAAAGAPARPGVGQQDVILRVGQQVGARRGRGRRGQPPVQLRGLGRPRRSTRGPGSTSDGSTIGASRGHALLQQELDGPDHRLGVEPAGHRVVEQGVGQGDQAHPLVVGHVRADDDRALALGDPVGGVVDRLVEAVGPLGPLVGQASEVLAGPRAARSSRPAPWRRGRRPGRDPARA